MPNLENLLTVAEFARRYPNIAASEQSVRWMLRQRHANGLIDSGAAIEMRTAAKQSRPRILLDPERMIPWMVRANPRAAATKNPAPRKSRDRSEKVPRRCRTPDSAAMRSDQDAR